MQEWNFDGLAVPPPPIARARYTNTRHAPRT